MNGYLWKVVDVPPDSPLLIDRTGKRTVAVTDGNTLTIYMSENLFGDFKTKVLLHELGHCMMFSYGYINYIHQMTYPAYWITMEEFICNLIADRCKEIYDKVYDIMGDEALSYVAYKIDNYV